MPASWNISEKSQTRIKGYRFHFFVGHLLPKGTCLAARHERSRAGLSKISFLCRLPELPNVGRPQLPLPTTKRRCPDGYRLLVVGRVHIAETPEGSPRQSGAAREEQGRVEQNFFPVPLARTAERRQTSITSSRNTKGDAPMGIAFWWWEGYILPKPLKGPPRQSGAAREEQGLARTTERRQTSITSSRNTKGDAPMGIAFWWWEEVDSNYRSRRRQIYSLIHLAALESSRMQYKTGEWLRVGVGAGDWNRTHNLLITNQLLCQLSYTNHRHRDFQSLALPTELPRHFKACLAAHICYQTGLFRKSGDPERSRTVDLQRDRLAF